MEMDENKSFQALINGVIRHDYYNETEFNDEFLKSELYASLTDDKFSMLLQKSRKILKSMVMTNMDMAQAEQFLTSQSKKQDKGISEAQAKVFTKMWKSHSSKIHDKLVEKCMWDNTLKSVNWRIDVKTRGSSEENVHDPSAIVELHIGSRHKDIQEADVVRFEMNEASVAKMMDKMKDIETEIQRHVKDFVQSW